MCSTIPARFNNDFLGNVKVVPLFPSGDTATLQWTPSTAGTHYTLVNETKDNDDTSYVEDATSGQVDLWNYQAAPSLGTIVWRPGKYDVQGHGRQYL